MDIKINEKYTLRSDPLNYWLEQHDVKTDKTTGEEKETVKRVSGYCNSLEHLLTSFASMRMRSSEAKDSKELIADFKVLESDLITLSADLGKKLDEILAEMREKYGKL